MRLKNWEKLKELRKNSLREGVEASLKAFDVSSVKLQLGYEKKIDSSVKVTIQLLCDVVLFARFEIEVEIIKDCIVLITRRGREKVSDKYQCHYLLVNLLRFLL